MTPESIESATSERKMIGSMFVVQAESIEAVHKEIESDVFYVTGVVSCFIRLLQLNDSSVLSTLVVGPRKHEDQPVFVCCSTSVIGKKQGRITKFELK